MTGVCKLSLQFSSGPSRCSFSTTLGQFHSGCLAKDCQLSDAVPSHNSTHLNPQPNPLCCWAGVCKGPWHLCSFSSLAPGECHTGVFSFICGQIPFFFSYSCLNNLTYTHRALIRTPGSSLDFLKYDPLVVNPKENLQLNKVWRTEKQELCSIEIQLLLSSLFCSCSYPT